MLKKFLYPDLENSYSYSCMIPNISNRKTVYCIPVICLYILKKSQFLSDFIYIQGTKV